MSVLTAARFWKGMLFSETRTLCAFFWQRHRFDSARQIERRLDFRPSSPTKGSQAMRYLSQSRLRELDLSCFWALSCPLNSAASSIAARAFAADSRACLRSRAIPSLASDLKESRSAISDSIRPFISRNRPWASVLHFSALAWALNARTFADSTASKAASHLPISWTASTTNCVDRT